jgi:hypothetical protein
MSTDGCGKVGLAVASPLIAGVGVGVLIGQGMMLCGDLMVEYINNKIKEQEKQYTDMYEAARMSTLSQVDQLRGRLSTQREYAGIATTHSSAELSLAEQETLRWSVAQARAALTDVNNQRRSIRVLEREALATQLKFDLEFHRTILPPKIIQQAERALNDSAEALRDAIAAVEKAHQANIAAQSQEIAERRQVQYMLQIVTNQLNSIDTMLQESGSPYQPEFLERRHTIEALVITANTHSETDIPEAMRLATEAQRVTRNLSNMVSTYLFDAWNSIHSQVNTLLGTLTTLQKMIEETRFIEMGDTQQLKDLTQRISTAYNDAQSTGQSSSLDVQHRLTVLAERVGLLKQDVFIAVEMYQQRSIAETIATTLAEIGFQAVTEDQAVLQDNGDVIHIAMTHKGTTSDGERDDRLVTFDVSRGGDVNYDFSGYTGDACVSEAERIFTAFRGRGVYLLNPESVEYLQKRYPDGVTSRMLNQSRFQLQPAKNKVQAELAERIATVLKQMQYHNIQQSASGGCIELEAFNGSIGYHVVLTPEGTMQVFKDTDHTNVSTDLHDPVVAEAQQVIEQVEQQEIQAQKVEIPGSKQQKKRSQQQTRRMLEN